MAESNTIRKISPLGFRVVVRIEPSDSTTEGGLYLPEGAKEKMAESVLAVVVEVASATNDSEDEFSNVSGIPLGAKVLIKKEAGVRIPWNESLRILETQEVLALVDEISLS